tara:strand:- start:75 stop:761 length:687 start_codon:yes stop_codon:yes gene_type:complete
MTHPTIFCKVKGCRFSNFHTTIAHRCGLCNQYGHGQMECNSVSKKQNLIQYLEDMMPQLRRCEFANCTYPWSHASESHHCFICGKRGTHSAPNCPMNHPPRQVQEQEQEQEQAEQNGAASRVHNIRLFNVPLYEENINNHVDHSESASKIPDTDYVMPVEDVDEVTNVNTPTNIIYKQCPMCRESSNVHIHLKLFTDSPCVICTENNPKILFSGCKHANVCYKCVERL